MVEDGIKWNGGSSGWNGVVVCKMECLVGGMK